MKNKTFNKTLNDLFKETYGDQLKDLVLSTRTISILKMLKPIQFSIHRGTICINEEWKKLIEK